MPAASSTRDGIAKASPFGTLPPLWQSRCSYPLHLVAFACNSARVRTFKFHMSQLLTRTSQRLTPDFFGFPFANHDGAASARRGSAGSTILLHCMDLQAPQPKSIPAPQTIKQGLDRSNLGYQKKHGGGA